MYETYQDGSGIGLFVDKERGVFRIHMCTYHKEKKIMCTPTVMVAGGWGVGRGGGEEPVGGLHGCRVGCLVGWLALKSWRCLEKVVPYVWNLVLSKVSV